MKTLISAPPLPILRDTRTSLSNTNSRGFESLTNPGGPAHEEIRHRAYSIWECAGRPANREVAHWLEAEAEVMGESDS